MFICPAVSFLSCAEKLVAKRLAICAPRLLKLFWEVKKHTSNSANKAAKNAVNRDCLEGSHLKELLTLPK
jgi:hypothetical protein